VLATPAGRTTGAASAGRTACLAPDGQRTVAAGNGTAKAIDHALKRWPALQRYATTGNLTTDNNNPVEYAIRPIAIGKKNWLFADSK
jgi:transposase